MWDNPSSGPMPIRIYADRTQESSPEELADHMTWRAALANDLRGLIIPVELGLKPYFRQDLRGLDVLEWTRFAGEKFRELPVLAVAWQDLESILRHRLSPLLLHAFTRFLQLPEAIERIPDFVREVRDGRFEAAGLSWERVLCGSDYDVRQVTHHDLANDFYAADRLWQGYRYALRDAAQEDQPAVGAELGRSDHVIFPWQDQLQRKLASPFFQKYQSLSIKAELPAYPDLIDVDGRALITKHVACGLAGNLRILMIDDEWQKGTGDVLLNILFRQEAFTYRSGHEAVFSENKPLPRQEASWARMVCVDSVERAEHWLRYWGMLPPPEGDTADETDSTRQWCAEWSQVLGRRVSHHSEHTVEDVLAHGNECVDHPKARPVDVMTVVVLDLRLSRDQVQPIYHPSELPSLQFRSRLKALDQDVPVLMFTASRQANNAITALQNGDESDGWLVKEAPDVLMDDANSSRAVLYLIERLHSLSELYSWYRSELEWSNEERSAYSRLHLHPDRESILGYISHRSTELFNGMLEGRFKRTSLQFKDFIAKEAPKRRLSIEQVLISRRLVVSALLWTCKPDPKNPEWEVDAFSELLPGAYDKRRMIKAPYNRVNFNTVLWMRSRDILLQLLKEEIQWLWDLPWPENRRVQISNYLSQANSLLAEPLSLVWST
jgi:hypothetical protein